MSQIIPMKEKAAELHKFINSRFSPQKLSKSLPNAGMSPERFLRMVLHAFSKNPKLYDCSTDSIYQCLSLSAQYGLPPTGPGGIWLVPYGKECTPIVDYRGMLARVWRSGLVKDVDADVVREGDFFEWEKGSNKHLRHRRNGDNGRPLSHSYCFFRLKTGGEHFDVLDAADIRKIRSMVRSNGGPWVKWEERMWIKSAVRRACQTLPLSDDDRRLMDIAAKDDSHDRPDLSDFSEPSTVDVDAEVRDPEPPAEPVGSSAGGHPEGGYTDEPF